MKKVISLITAVLIMCAALTGCGDQPEDISMYDLNQALVGFTEDPDNMKYASSADSNPAELLSHVSSIDYAKVNAFFITYAANGTGNADEIVVIQLKKKSDVNEAASSLRIHLDTRRTLYATYDKTQTRKLEKAKLFTRGHLVVLMVCDQVDKMENAFVSFFNK